MNSRKALESDGKAEDDPDMQRATNLVELHYGIKSNHMEGEDADLRQARLDVDRVLNKLEWKHDKMSVTKAQT